MARRKISLNQLIEQLFNVPVPGLPTQQEQSEIKPTTIRPDAKTSHFFGYHAERLNISMQDMMALALNAVAAATQSPVLTEFQLAVDRFKHIFEAHRVPQIHAKQIIDSYGSNKFPLGGMTNDAILLENYTPAVKEALSQIFGVRPDWLSGTGDHAIVADPIYSRDYAYAIWHNLRHPQILKGLEIKNRSLLLVKADIDRGIIQDGLELPNEILLFTVVEYVVDAHMRFKTYHLNGIFPLANKEARIGLQSLLLGVNEIHNGLSVHGATYSQDAIIGIKLGLLPVDCFDDGFPTLWDPFKSLCSSTGTEVEMLIDLLRSTD
jgi:hypothetical protein